MGLFCLLHSLCVSEPFAALPPLRIAELYIAFAMPINAHLCPCLSKQSARYYAVANPCFTSPLPRNLCLALALQNFAKLCDTLPLRRFSLQFHSIATPRLSVANIASHAAAKPDCALPLRGTSNLYSAVATNCIPKPLRTQHCPTKPLLCGAVNATPSLRFAHHAVAVRCLSSPLAIMPLPRETMRFHAYPLLFEAFRSFS